MFFCDSLAVVRFCHVSVVIAFADIVRVRIVIDDAVFCYRDVVGEQQGCPVAEVYEAFESARENPCNASVSLTMKLNLDFHPNAYGHTLIAQQVSSLLTAPGESRTPAQPVYGVGVSQPPQAGDGEALGAWMALIGGTGVCLVLCLQKSQPDRWNESQSDDTGRRRMK